MEFEQVKQLIKAVSDSSLTSFSYEESALKIVMERYEPEMPEVNDAKPEGICQKGDTPLPAGAAKERVPAPAASKDGAGKDGNLVTSPLVGTFYAAPSEEAEPYVKVGDTVKKGQVIAIIEAMKLMNDIECEYDGVVAEIFVKNKEMVDYGKPLFRIE